MPGLPQYWLVDLEPEPRILVRRLGEDGRYHVIASVDQAASLKTDEPFPFTVDVAALVD